MNVNTNEFKDLRLAYAQHVYKAQGLTVQRSFVLIGGWQTDRERAYVALSRSQERTDIYVSREDLGEQGMDAGAIERLGEAMAESHAQHASITRSVEDRDFGQGAEPKHAVGRESSMESERKELLQQRDSEAGRVMRESEQHDRDRDIGQGIE